MGGTRLGSGSPGRPPPMIGRQNVSCQPIPTVVSVCFAFYLHSTASGQTWVVACGETRGRWRSAEAGSRTGAWLCCGSWLAFKAMPGEPLRFAGGIPLTIPPFQGPVYSGRTRF